jgi:hypothetical protein
MFISRALFLAVMTAVAALSAVISGLLLILVVVGTLRGDEDLNVGTSLMLAVMFAVGGAVCWRLRKLFELPPGD